MKTFVHATLLLLLVAATAMAQSDEWQPLMGPYGGTVSGFAVNASGDIFAATDNGVYRSSNNAASWQKSNVGIPITSILSIGIATNGTLFAGTTDAGLFRSTDNGATWEKINPEASIAYVGQIVTSRRTEEVIEGTGSEIFRSTDNGSTWKPLGFTLGPDAVALDSMGGLLVATQGMLLRSSDNARSIWDTLDVTSIDSIITTVAVTPVGELVVGTAGSGLYRSSDTGATWSRIETGLNDSLVRTTTIGTDGTIALGTRDGRLLLGKVSGTEWREVAERFQIIYQVIFQTAPSPTLLATSDGLFVTADSGATWHRQVEGLISTFISTLSRRSDGTIFAGTFNGRLFRTSDNGGTWERSTIELDRRISVSSVAFLSSGTTMLGTVGDGAWYSIDNGTTWERGDTVLRTGITINAILVSRSGAIVVASDSGRIYRSTDNGISFNKVVVDSSLNMLSMAQDSTGLIVVGTSLDVHISTDDGITWIASGSGISSRFVYSVAASRTGTLYAGAYNGNVFRSTDHGATWIRSTADRDAVIIITLAVDTNGVVFAGASNRGPYRSDDKGVTWRPYNTGLTSRSSYGFVFDAEGRLYTGTAGAGGFRSVNRTSSVPVAPSGSDLSFSWRHNNDLLMLTIDFKRPQGVSVELFSMQGERLVGTSIKTMSTGVGEISIPTGDLAAGRYLCRVRGEQGVAADEVVTVVR